MNSNSDLDALRAWQQNFYRGIFDPSEDHVQQACTDVVASETLSAKARLEIYRNSILGGITTALMGIYPVCVKLVGEVYFTQMVSGYLRQHPSSSPDVGGYGEFLADYLTDFIASNRSANELIYLPDVARLEWLWHKAFNASETVKHIFPLAELANVLEDDQGDIRFVLDPSVAVMTSLYPIHKIWQLNQDDASSEGHAESIHLDEGRVNLSIRRRSDYGMVIDLISVDEHQFLSAISANNTFAEIAVLEYEASINDLLANALQSGLIIGFQLSS